MYKRIHYVMDQKWINKLDCIITERSNFFDFIIEIMSIIRNEVNNS